MLKNRDSARTNKANKAVRACLYGKIANDTLECIRKTGDAAMHSSSASLLAVAEKSNQIMIDHFCKSTDNLNKEICYNYASNQHNLILAAMKNNENISEVKCISPYIIDNSLLELYEKFHQLKVTPSKSYSFIYFYLFLLPFTSNDICIYIYRFTSIHPSLPPSNQLYT